MEDDSVELQKLSSVELQDSENIQHSQFGFIQNRKWFKETAAALAALCEQENSLRLSESNQNVPSASRFALSTPLFRTFFPQGHDGHVLEITNPDRTQKTRVRITPGSVKLDSGPLTIDTIRVMVEAFKKLTTPDQILAQKKAGKRLVITASSEEVAKSICTALGEKYTNIIDSIAIRNEKGKIKKITYNDLFKGSPTPKPVEKLDSAANTPSLPNVDTTEVSDNAKPTENLSNEHPSAGAARTQIEIDPNDPDGKAERDAPNKSGATTTQEPLSPMEEVVDPKTPHL